MARKPSSEKGEPSQKPHHYYLALDPASVGDGPDEEIYFLKPVQDPRLFSVEIDREPGLVILGGEHSSPIQIDSGATMGKLETPGRVWKRETNPKGKDLSSPDLFSRTVNLKRDPKVKVYSVKGMSGRFQEISTTTHSAVQESGDLLTLLNDQVVKATEDVRSTLAHVDEVIKKIDSL